MKKKLRKFSEGGVNEGMNPNIDEDTRSRAMKFVENASEESRDIGAPVTRAASKSTSSVSKTVAPPTKSKVDEPYSKPSGDYVNPEKGLEKVYPVENVLLGGGASLLKPMLKHVVEAGAKRTAKEVASKNVARKSEEGFNPSEAMDALKPTRTVKIKDKEIPVKQGKPNFGKSTEGMGAKEVTTKSGKKIPVKRQKEEMVDDGGSGAFKRGGSVSSASRRADGCAIRGKTRA
jgi:hypothetical protein